MLELTFEEVDEVSGAVDWMQAGYACGAFGGAALTLGNVPAAAVLGVAAIICFAIA